MNELIRKFERQSHLDVYSLGKDRAKWESVVDKFAELILTECCEFIEQGHHSMVDRLSLSKNIKEYFGVE